MENFYFYFMIKIYVVSMVCFYIGFKDNDGFTRFNFVQCLSGSNICFLMFNILVSCVSGLSKYVTLRKTRVRFNLKIHGHIFTYSYMETFT